MWCFMIVPSVMILEIITLQLATAGVCLPMIFEAWGGSFPCYIQDFIYVQTLAAYILILPMRSLQLIIIFDASARKAYYRHFKLVKFSLLGGVVTCFIAFYTATATNTVRGCKKM